MTSTATAASALTVAAAAEADRVRRISIVIPVYRGETTLPRLLAEIAPMATEQRSPGGRAFRVCEV